MPKKPVHSEKPPRVTGCSRTTRAQVFSQMAVHGLVTARSVSRFFEGGAYDASWQLEKLCKAGHCFRIKIAVEDQDQPLLCYTRKRFADIKDLLDAYTVLHFCQIQEPKRKLLNQEQFERLISKLGLGLDSGPKPPKYQPCYAGRSHKGQLRLALMRVFASTNQEQVIAKTEAFVGHRGFKPWRVAVLSERLQLTLLVPGKSEMVRELRKRFHRRPLLSRVLGHEPVEVPVRVYTGNRPILKKTRAPKGFCLSQRERLVQDQT